MSHGKGVAETEGTALIFLYCRSLQRRFYEGFFIFLFYFTYFFKMNVWLKVFLVICYYNDLLRSNILWDEMKSYAWNYGMLNMKFRKPSQNWTAELKM